MSRGPSKRSGGAAAPGLAPRTRGLGDRLAFGVGTAATIAPIHRLGLDGRDVRLEDHEGSIARRLRTELFEIQTGLIGDRHGWLLRV